MKLATLIAAASAAAAAGMVHPPDNPREDIIARFEFEGADSDGWGNTNAHVCGSEVLPRNGVLGITIASSSAPTRACVDSPPMRFPADETVHLVVRMRQVTGPATLCVWWHTGAGASGSGGSNASIGLGVREDGISINNTSAQRQRGPWEPGDYRESCVYADRPASDWGIYAVPFAAANTLGRMKRAGNWTSNGAFISRIRVFPAVEMASYGKVDVDWIRIMRSPVIHGVSGCSRPQTGGSAITPALPPVAHPGREHACDVDFLSRADAEAFTSPATGEAARFTATFGCAHSGGDTIMVAGHAFGTVPPDVFVGGMRCTNVKLLVSQSLLSCVVPASKHALQRGALSSVQVRNAMVTLLDDSTPLLQYTAIEAAPHIVLANIAAASVDIGVAWPMGTRACPITALGVEWVSGVAMREPDSSPPYTLHAMANITDLHRTQRLEVRAPLGMVWEPWESAARMTTANLSVITMRGLRPGTPYRFRVFGIAEPMHEVEPMLRAVDAYGRRGLAQSLTLSPSQTADVQSLHADVLFTRFDASSTLDHGPVHKSTLDNTARWRGGEGHYGLLTYGSAHIANCNASTACCDNFGGVEYQSTEMLRHLDDMFLYQPLSIDFDPARNATMFLPAELDNAPTRMLAYGMFLRPRGTWFRLLQPADAWPGIDDDGMTVFMSSTEYERRRANVSATLAERAEVPSVLKTALHELDPVAAADYATRALDVRDANGRRIVPLARDPRASCTIGCTCIGLSDGRRLATQQPNASAAGLALEARIDGRHAVPFQSLPAENLTASRASMMPTAPCGPALRLTPSQHSQRGAALYARPVVVAEGFETEFVFRLANPSMTCRHMDKEHTFCRAHGGRELAFVLAEAADFLDQRRAVLRVVLSASDITGYASVYITSWLPSGEALNISEPSTAVPDWSDGVHTLRIVFRPMFTADDVDSDAWHPWVTGEHALLTCVRQSCGVMDVFMDGGHKPVLRAPVPLRGILGRAAMAHGRAWVGFTAQTSEHHWQVHDILAWYFIQQRHDNIDVVARIDQSFNG